MNQQTSSPTGPSVAPDFKQVRKYLRNIQQREALGAFIKAGWTPAELGEYARFYLHRSKTYPTAVSYQIVVEWGPEHFLAKEYLASMRAPGYTLPPLIARYSSGTHGMIPTIQITHPKSEQKWPR
jgi:hypothetical protein